MTVRPPLAQRDEAPSSAFEIALANGVMIRVQSTFDPAALARLLDVVTQARAVLSLPPGVRRFVAQLAHPRRARPRSESVRRLKGQFVLPLDGIR